MTSFTDQLAAAKAAPRPTRDVQILLDAGLADQRAALQERLESARAETARDPRLTTVDTAGDAIQEELDALIEASAASLVTLRFTRLPGGVWSDITERCPARLDAPLDQQYGYNMSAACRIAAPLSGVRVEGEELIELEHNSGRSDWTDLFDTISGHEFILIIQAIYELNMYEPSIRVEQIKKELATRPA